MFYAPRHGTGIPAGFLSFLKLNILFKITHVRISGFCQTAVFYVCKLKRGEYADDGPMNLSGSRFGVSRLSGKGYPMKMVVDIESVSMAQRLKKEFGL